MDLTTPGLRACVLRFTHEDGSPGQMCGYLEPEPDGTLSFITREGMEWRQMRRDLDAGLARMTAHVSHEVTRRA